MGIKYPAGLFFFMFYLDLIRANRIQWNTYDEFNALQYAKFKKVFINAYKNVPYYRKLFVSSDIHPNDIKCLDDIKHIPFLEKSTIQSNPLIEFLDKRSNIKKLKVKSTGGSTGNPLKIYLSKDEILKRTFIDYRCLKALGLKHYHKQVYFRDPDTFRKDSTYQKLGIFRRSYISIFDPVEVQVEKLNKLKSHIICGDPTILETIGTYIKDHKGFESIKKNKFIISTSQLASESELERISKYFNAPVYNFYGAIEFGVIGYQCKVGRKIHLNADSTYCEFIDTDFTLPGGIKGYEIICTTLDNLTMPLIRYRLGDIVIPSSEKCACGRILPLIEIVAGRKNEYILTKSGKKLPSILFTVTMRKYNFVNQFKIYQKKIDRLDIHLSVNDNFNEINKKQLISDIQELIGSKIDINLEIKPEFKEEKPRKLKTIFSDLITT